MKKLLLSAVAVLMFTVAASAQEQGTIRASLGLAAGSKAGFDLTATDPDDVSQFGIGVNLGAEYFITDVISVAPSYTFFFNSSETVTDTDPFEPTTFEQTVKPRVFNLDGRYYFGDDIKFYALAGLAFQSVSFESEFGGFSGSFDGSATTFNLGGGVNIPLGDALSFYGQVKLMGGDDNETFDGTQFVIGTGLAYAFN